MRGRPLVVMALAFSSLAATLPARADDTACIAANEEALALRKSGKLHESLKPLAACADPSCPAEIKTECSQRIEDVKAQLPTLTFLVKDRKGGDVTGVVVTMDGAPLPGVLAGVVPVDPGEHTFRFEAPGQPPAEKKLLVRAGEKDRRETVVVGAPPPPGFWTPQRAAAAAVTGAGVVGLALGAVFAVFASSAKSKETGDCTVGSCLNYPQAVADYDAATKNATGSTVGFVAGGVLAAAGIVLFLTAPKPKPAPEAGRALFLSPLVAGSRGGLSLGGSF